MDPKLEKVMQNCTISLIKALDMFYESEIIKIDPSFHLILIWKGGHGVNIYDFEGNLRYFYNTGSFEKDNATEKEITDSMNKRIENKDYESYVI